MNFGKEVKETLTNKHQKQESNIQTNSYVPATTIKAPDHPPLPAKTKKEDKEK